MTSWAWEEVDTDRSGSSGDLAKLFKNEEVGQPGILAEGAPSPDATLLAREVIQNSWDAARELRASMPDDRPEFHIEFRYVDLVGEEKREISRALGLGELHDRADRTARAKIGLSDHNCLDSLDGPDPLRLLVISESGTTGMYGPFKGTKSKMYLALVSIGVTIKNEGEGGSYGYGKAGLIRGSATRTVIAYTCFRERPDDPGVTRRLLGMTYWGPHEIDDVSSTGFSRFGQMSPTGATIPFENEAADAVAASLGLDTRSASDDADLGSTFLLVDPTVEPEELNRAIERSWWPALYEHEFSIDIICADGRPLRPRPKKDPVLKTFIRAYELATVPQDNPQTGEVTKKFGTMTLSHGERVEVGQLGLVSDISGWSYPMTPDDEDTGIDHRNLVALVRGPRMVVEYHETGSRMPFVRGAFVAAHDIDDLLRQTEPKAHDAWQAKANVDGTDPDAPIVAGDVLKRIKNHVNAFRRTLKPSTPRRKDVRLPVLEELFRQVVESEGNGGTEDPPPSPPRDVSIHVVEQDLELATEAAGLIRMRARVSAGLGPEHAGHPSDGYVTIRYLFVEDGTSGQRCDLEIQAPDAFRPVDGLDGVFVGRLDDEPVLFDVLSSPYSPDWTGNLLVSADLVEPIGATVGADVAGGENDGE